MKNVVKNIWVIKAGGELLTNPAIRKKIVSDLKKNWKKNPVVFVHGGGPQIEQELKRNKIPMKFVGGRRMTSLEAMIVVERVLSGEINKGFVAQLVKSGLPAVGLSCRDGGLITAQPLPGLGRAGRPKTVNGKFLLALLKAKLLPVISTVGSDKTGEAININADDAASAIARTLQAKNLVFMTNISGVLDDKKKRIPVLKIKNIDKLIEEKIITGGMIPKVQSARNAIISGVGEVDIVNGAQGIHINEGTRIVP